MNSLEVVKTDILVIGAGLIGLACAARFSKRADVILIESEGAIGTQTSSRNSEVIHAGIYNDSEMLKTTLCVEGSKLLYEYCEQRNVTAKRVGKLIVANGELEEETLCAIYHKALRNGVENLNLIGRQKIMTIEPEICATSAVHSENTGIIDSHGLMTCLESDIIDNGGQIAFHTKALSIMGGNYSVEVLVSTLGGEHFKILANQVILAVGHGTVELLHSSHTSSEFGQFSHAYAKGTYFSLPGKSPFNHLIYPIPNENGLGIHATIDLTNKVKFGPDFEWVNEYSTSVEVQKMSMFVEEISRYWPKIKNVELLPGYAGVRPKIFINGDMHNDFLILTDKEHQISGLFVLAGIDSPGLTASLAIAKYVDNLF